MHVQCLRFECPNVHAAHIVHAATPHRIAFGEQPARVLQNARSPYHHLLRVPLNVHTAAGASRDLGVGLSVVGAFRSRICVPLTSEHGSLPRDRRWRALSHPVLQ